MNFETIETGAKDKTGATTPTKQLMALWPAWNDCPAGLDSDDRIALLTGDFDAGDAETGTDFVSIFGSLKGKYSFLPIDPEEFTCALNLAKVFTDLIDSATNTKRNFPSLITNHWAFQSADRQMLARLAILRTLEELAIMSPKLLECGSPSAMEVQEIDNRRTAYSLARTDALRRIDNFCAKTPLVRSGTAEPGRANQPKGDHVAALFALGICSEGGFKKFLSQELPTWPREQQLRFFKICSSNRFGNTKYFPLQIWIADNLPVFERFGWRPDDVIDAAKQNQIATPRKLPSLTNQWEVTWKLKPGDSGLDQKRQVALSTPLLSPAPAFSVLLSGTE